MAIFVVGAVRLSDEVELEVKDVAFLVHQVLLVLTFDLHSLEFLAIVHNYRVLFYRLCPFSSIVYQALHSTALLVCDKDLVFVLDRELRESSGTSEELPQFLILLIYLFELLLNGALVLGVHVVAGPCGSTLKQPLHSTAVHVCLQYLVLFLESQTGDLCTDNLPQLGISLVDQVELFIYQFRLVFLTLLFILFGFFLFID